MKEPGATGMGLLLLLAFGGACAPSSLPVFLHSQPGPETGSLAAPRGPYETEVVVSGTPTEVYALVARGVLNCWFGADGPLKDSHEFRAQADPPAKGGAAEIIIYERDATLRDQRGARAYRVTFTGVGAIVRVAMSARRFDQAVAQVMAKDIGAWAKGNTGCRLPALLPPREPLADTGGKRRTAARKR